MKGNTNARILGLLLILLCTFISNAQRDVIGIGGGVINISGNDLVTVNDTRTYTANSPGNIIYAGTWSVSGATVLSQSLTSITVRWTQSGQQNIIYTATNTTVGYLQGRKRVTVNALNTVSTPSQPTIISQNCTSTVLQRGNPPSGVTWYWQGTNVSGTSTSNANLTYAVTASGWYFLSLTVKRLNNLYMI